MIEKVQNAWIQIRCEQKSFKRAQVLKNLVVIHDKNFSKSLSCILEPLSFDIQLMLFWTHNVFCQDHDETLENNKE